MPESGFKSGQAVGFHPFFRFQDLSDSRQEPRVESGGLMDFAVRESMPHRLRDQPQAVRRSCGKRFRNGVSVNPRASVRLAFDDLAPCIRQRRGVRVADDGVFGNAFHRDFIEAGQVGFQRNQRLLQTLVDGPPDCHRLADGFHRRAQLGLRAGEFLERKARHLRDHVVDRRFERGRSSPRDIVREFVERVADGEFRRDSGDRKAGGLRGKRGRTRNARVHFDDDHPSRIRIQCPLDVRAAGLDADLAQNCDRAVPHPLIFLVREGERRSDRNRVAGMDSHGIDVLDRTDDDRIVRDIPDDLHLEFFPSQETLVDQDLPVGRSVEAGPAKVFVVVFVVGDSAARASKRESRSNDGGQADMLQSIPGLVETARDPGFGAFETDFVHRLSKKLPILRFPDGRFIRADQLDAIFRQHAAVRRLQRRVQGRLSAHGRKKRAGPLRFEDFGDDFRGDRFNVGRVRHARVGHDRSRVRIEQHDSVALFLESLARLNARVIEFARLADHDRTCSDDHD